MSDDGRGGRRRKSSTGRAAASALGMALLSTVLPGVGHMRSGRKRVGVPVFVIFCLLIAGGVYVGMKMDRMELLSLAVNPDVLSGLIVCSLLLAVAWTAVIVSAYQIRRPGRMRPMHAITSAFVVGVLSLAVSTPPIYAARYAFVGRDVIKTVFPGAGQQQQHRKTKTGKDPWAGRPRINVLLLGGDGGKDRTGVRTDSMTVASIDTHTGDTVLFSLPRNLQHAPMPARLRSQFPNGFTDLLNAVYPYGADNPQKFPGMHNHGAAAIQEVVQQILGLKIDYYILVNLRAFREIINAIGGITVYVENNLPIGGEGGVPITGYVHKGLHHLDGNKALWYARSRASSDDYHRMRRQRCVLGAIAKQAKPATVLKGFQKIAATTKQNVSTDIPNEDLPALVKLGEKAKSAKISSLQFVPPLVNTANPDFAQITAKATKAVHKAEKQAERDRTHSPGTTKRPKPHTTGSSDKPQSLDQVCRYQ